MKSFHGTVLSILIFRYYHFGDCANLFLGKTLDPVMTAVNPQTRSFFDLKSVFTATKSIHRPMEKFISLFEICREKILD